MLEGSVRKSGNRIRVTAQLVEAATGNHVWAERYDRDLADIFAVQDEITERVVAAIEPELYAAENIRSQRKVPESLDAWECVIRALSAIGQGTREANTEAERLCRRAIAVAPAFGQAHSLLAWALLRRTMWSGDLRTVASEISTETQAALALDDRDPWAHLAPLLGASRSARGAHQEAIDSALHALRLRPSDRSVGMFASLALMGAHFGAGRYAECVTWARTMIERSPEHIGGHQYLIAVLAMEGDMSAAAAARDTLLRLRPEFSLAWMRENLPVTGETAERLRDGLRKAGVPDE